MHQSELIATDIDAYLAQHEQKEMLRFLTCGSVDDGKSTLIGRLLYDSKMVYEDQLAALEVDSKRFGTTGGAFDPALLTDGLRAEREQGITIDVAYRYFSTTKRKFIIADTPGHEQYTRNMATGASNCDLAIILVDARQGVLTQTRRHSFIVALLGIRHVVVAINKMDLVNFDEAVFNRIVRDYTDFAAKLEIPDVEFVPISALNGDNVVHPSDKMPWYTGGTLMHHLENVYIASDRNLIDLRFPVQYVNRPHLNFRGYCGTLASGVIRPGDAVIALPSRRRSTVKSIVTFDGEPDRAFAPQAVTVTLNDEIDVSRGDMLVHVHNQPRVSDTIEAMVVWMTDEPLAPDRPYLIKHTTRTTPAVVREIRYRMDVNTLHRQDADQLGLNEIGRCVIDLGRAIAFDPYKTNRGTGGFILIDRLTNNTVGAGMILDRDPSQDTDTRQRATREHGPIHRSLISPEQRQRRLGHKPATLWLTGLTGSGKSSIAYALEKRLFDRGASVVVLDGRNARLGLSADLHFSDDDRRENLRRAAEVAKLLNEAGHLVVCAFESPLADARAAAAEVVGADRFIEVYLDAPADVCRQRVASHGKAQRPTNHLTPFGHEDTSYEPPAAPAATLKTAELSLEACVDQLVSLLADRHILA